MKMKLLLFLGLIIGSLSASAVFSTSANAAGETYRWQDENTIIGTGGSYDNEVKKNVDSGTTTRAIPVGSVTFKREGTSAIFKAPTSNIFYVVETSGTRGGASMCNLQLSITVDTKNVSTGSVQPNDPGQKSCPNSGIGATAGITGTGPDPATFTAAGGGGTGATDEVSTCQIDGVGWIICPVMNFIGGITDQAYVAVQALLTTQPLSFSTTGNPINDAWTIMRNFANIVFVIVFLLIIFSQLTSIGVSNYGIKKILPRLIIVAILVNASYIICALALDISNILGSSLKSLFDGITANYKVSLGNEQTAGVFNGQNMFTNVIGAVLAGGTAIGITTMLGLSVLLPIAITALAAIVTVVVVLTLRQALIIALIVISPLAFIAFLLPNTEGWFTKWRKLFMTLLLMYPVIAVIFGVSAFTGAIIMNSASGDTKVLVQIMGAGVTIIPLFITPVIMKTAGTFLNRIGGNLNNPNKGPFDRMRKGAEGIRKRQEGRRSIRALSGERTMGFGKYQRAAKRSRVESGIESERKRAEADYLSQKTLDSASFRNKAAGGLTIGPDAPQEAIQRAMNSAIDVQAQIEASEIKAASAQIEHAAIPNDMIQALAMGKREYIENGVTKPVTLGDSDAMRKAAIQQQVASGQADKISALVDQYGGQKSEESKTLANALQSSSGRPGWIGAGAIEAIRQGEAVGKNGLSTTETQIEGAIKSGAYSPEKMASADADDLKMVADYVHKTNQNATPEQKAQRDLLVKNAQTALSDPILSTKLGKRGSNVEAIAYQTAGVDPAAARTTGPSTNTSQTPPAAPGTLNIQHTPPANANPGNARTAPPQNTNNFNGNNRSPGGVYVPNGYQAQPQQPPQNPPQGPPSNTP